MNDNKYIKRQEIMEFSCKKLPVIFCIDVSDSMNQCKGGVPTGQTVFSDGKMWNIVTGETHSIMDTLREKVKDFHNAMKNDKKTSYTCQTSYLTFGDHPELIEDFGIVANKDAPVDKLIAEANSTYIVDALEMALKLLDEQKELIRSLGSKYFQPWLVILTDGEAQDDPERIKNIKRELCFRQKNNKLIVYTIALSEEKELYEQIRGYSVYKPIPYDDGEEEMKKFFLFLKKSVSSISQGKISDRVRPYTEPDDIPDLQ